MHSYAYLALSPCVAVRPSPRVPSAADSATARGRSLHWTAGVEALAVSAAAEEAPPLEPGPVASERELFEEESPVPREWPPLLYVSMLGMAVDGPFLSPLTARIVTSACAACCPRHSPHAP